MSQRMCMFEPRFKPQIVVRERQSFEFERRLRWMEPQVDILKVCVGVLTYELIRPREQLKKAISTILEPLIEEVVLRNEVNLQENPLAQVVHQAWRSNYENVTVQRQKGKSRTEDIFVFGYDAQKIDTVVKHAMHEIKGARRNLEIATLTLNGPSIGNLISSAYRELLAAEESKHGKPDVLVIILEEFTSNMFSSFQGSGFVNAKRAAGLDVIIIGCSTDCRDAKHASIWREFKHKIFVPCRKDEEPWIPENEVKAAGDEDMVVHKSGVSNGHDAEDNDAGDVIYATVHKNPLRLRENEVAQGRENETMPPPQGNSQPSLAGQYVEVEVEQPKMNNGTRNSFAGQSETIPIPIPSAADGDFIDSAYSTLHPVTKNPPQPPPKPVVVEQQPRREAGEQPVFWTKNRSEFVALHVEPPVVVGGGRPFDEFPIEKEEKSYCDKIINCIVGAYACLLD